MNLPDKLDYTEYLFKYTHNNNINDYYSILLPPPNVTGELHIGHALNVFLQDAIARKVIMSGKNISWNTGLDHAGIATQNIVEKYLYNVKNTTRYDIGKDEFIKITWEWIHQYSDKIKNQLKKMNLILNLDSSKFSLDKDVNKFVYDVFYKLYNDNLIYRDTRLVNYCINCSTVLADIEVKHINKKGYLYYIKYKGVDIPDLIVATTRPETLIGDTAIAINPNDSRYSNINGNVQVPIINRVIPIIKNSAIDPLFGTGAVKVTPAHSKEDYRLAQEHNLQYINIFDKNKVIIKPFSGVNVNELRSKVVNALKDNLLSQEKYVHSVPVCDRCGNNIEFIISKQWFIKVKPLINIAIDGIKKNNISCYPSNIYSRVIKYLEEMEDWCISRQLWWGHRIPLWETNDKQYITYNSSKSKEVEDVLDTWFSSSLWPLIMSEYTTSKNIFKQIYPIDLLVTGYDILFFWVARMCLLSTYVYYKDNNIILSPFKNILITGLIRDKKGQKMSKSKGNGIDPLLLIDQYGSDALRFSLLRSFSPGADILLSEHDVKISRNICTKLWNLYKFASMNDLKLKNNLNINKNNIDQLDVFDIWIISQLNDTIKNVNSAYNNYRFDLVSENLYHFFKNNLCDTYIEFYKLSKDNKIKQNILEYILFILLKLFHIFIPQVTGYIYTFYSKNTLLDDRFPIDYDDIINKIEDKDIHNNIANDIIRIITHIRSFISKQNINYKDIVAKFQLFHLSEYEGLISQITKLSINTDNISSGNGYNLKLLVGDCSVTLYGIKNVQLQSIIKLKEKLKLDYDKLYSKYIQMQSSNKVSDSAINIVKSKIELIKNELNSLS